MKMKISVQEKSVNKFSIALAKICKSISPIYYLCRYSGIQPISLRKKDGTAIAVPAKKDAYYSVFYFITYCSISVYGFVRVKNDTLNFNIVPKVFVEAEVVIMILLKLLTVAMAFVFRKKYSESLNIMAYIDVGFEKASVTIDYRLTFRRVIILFFIMIASVMVRFALMLTTVQVDFVQQLALFLAALIKSLLKYQFIAFVLLLHLRFKTINRSIKSLYKNSKNRHADPVHLHGIRKVTEQLYIFCRLHYKLCCISRLFNASFQFQLLLSVATSLYDILFQSYYLYVVFSARVSHVEGNMIACAIAWLIDEVTEVYLLVSACAATIDAAKKIAVILHEMRNCTTNMELESHIQMYSLQMLHQRIEFSVVGFFVLDYTLIYSILGAVTTYLVIFIQFDQSQFSLSGPSTSDTFINRTAPDDDIATNL